MVLPSGPVLAGLRVLDASRILAGPICAQILGDLGAEVIKVERPGAGDDTRSWGPPFDGPLSAYFLSCNRNKKSLTLDLANSEGAELLRQLVAKSDMLIENFLPATAKRLGLDRESLWKSNPRLCIGSITGYGHTGPWRERPGYDFAIQGLSGMMSITGPAEGPPSKIGVALTDVITGLYLGIGLLACVRAAERTGRGYALDLALLDCAVASQVNVAQAYLSTGVVPPRQGNAHLQIVPYQLFPTKDDWIILAVGNDGQFQRFCSATGHIDWASDSKFATNVERVHNRAEIVPLVEAEMKQRTTAEWYALLDAADVPYAPVSTYAEVFSSEQLASRGMKATVKDATGREYSLIGSPFHIEGSEAPPMTCPPRLGEHTASVLGEVLGLSATQIEELKSRRVV